MKKTINLDMEEYKNRFTQKEKIARLYRIAERLDVQIGGNEDGHTERDSETGMVGRPLGIL